MDRFDLARGHDRLVTSNGSGTFLLLSDTHGDSGVGFLLGLRICALDANHGTRFPRASRSLDLDPGDDYSITTGGRGFLDLQTQPLGRPEPVQSGRETTVFVG